MIPQLKIHAPKARRHAVIKYSSRLDLVLLAFASQGNGLTDEELGHRCGGNMDTVRLYRRDLTVLGMVSDSGMRRKVSGRKVSFTVWVLTTAGAAKIKLLKIKEKR